jgi:hypothetical protein
LKSQAEAKAGRPVVSVTALVVKVAQNADASAAEAVNAEAQTWLEGLSHPKTRGMNESRSALRIMMKE